MDANKCMKNTQGYRKLTRPEIPPPQYSEVFKLAFVFSYLMEEKPKLKT